MEADGSGVFLPRGLSLGGEEEVIRGGVAWDGDLYGWDEAVVYMWAGGGGCGEEAGGEV